MLAVFYLSSMIIYANFQVDALILCERLRDAYVEALKEDSVQDIERIRIQAVKLRQNHVIDICQRFLKNYEEKMKSKTK